MRLSSLITLGLLVCGLAVSAHGQSTASIDGSILSQLGHPIAGAKIELFTLPLTEKSPPAAASTSDRAGRYALEIPIPSMGVLRVSSPGKAPVWAPLTPLVHGFSLPTAVLSDSTAVKPRPNKSYASPKENLNRLWQKSHRAASTPFPPTLRWKTSTIPESPAVFTPRFDEKFAALAGARLPPQPVKAGIQWSEFPPFLTIPTAVRPPTGVRGRVVSPLGEPVSGALVWPSGEPQAAIQTDSVGQFPWPLPLQTEPGADLKAVAPGFLTSSAPVPNPDDGRKGSIDPRLRLQPATSSLVGLVVDPQGDPISGAQVSLQRHLDSWQTLTDKNGRFHLHRLPAYKRFQLTVAHPLEGQTQHFVGSIKEGQTARAELILMPQDPIRGIVIDEDSSPLTDLKIELWDPEGLRSVTYSDSDGVFVFNHQPGDRMRLVVQHPGFVKHAQRIVFDGTQARLDLGKIRLIRAIPFHGRVVDQAGDGIEGVQVRATHPKQQTRGASGFLAGYATETDQDGSFVFRRFAPGQPVMLGFYSASHPALEVKLDRSEVLSATEQPWTVELKSGVVVIGAVVDEQGKPIPGAQILHPRNQSFNRTDDQGEFDLGPLGLGAVSLKVSAVGFLPANREIELEDIDEGPLEIEIMLTRGQSLRGLVLDAQGDPMPGVSIRWNEPKTNASADPFRFIALSSSTDADGRFDLQGLDLETGFLSADSPTHGRIEIHAGELRGAPRSENRIVLQFAGTDLKTIHGCAFGSTSSWPKGGEIRLIHQQTHIVRQARLSENGCFSISDLNPAVYRWSFHVSEHDGQGWILDRNNSLLDLNRYDEPEITVSDLRFYRGATIHGTLRGLSAEELYGARIEAASGSQQRLAIVDSGSGAFKLVGLPAGVWNLSLTIDGEHRQSEKVTLSPSEHVVLDW